MVYSKLTFDEIKRRVKIINSNIDILNETEPKGNNEDPYICHCNKCGGTFNENRECIMTTYSNYKKGHKETIWCPICTGKKCVSGINDVATVRPDLVYYFVNSEEAKQYTIGSHKKVLVKCPCCGYEKEMEIKQLVRNGFSCRICSDGISYPNKICRSMLMQLPVDEYIFEYRDKWTKGKIYDAYFIYKNKKYLLEFDGIQHFRDCNWSTKEHQYNNDELKNNLAQENGYILIRINSDISDFDYIKNTIYQSQLSNLFNLDMVDWKQCEKYTLTSLIYEIANYYNNNYVSSVDIAKEFHIGKTSALRYLYRADKVGLCKFSVERSYTLRSEKVSKHSREKESNQYNVYDPQHNFIGKFCTVNDSVAFLKEHIDNIKFTKQIVTYALYSGCSYKGYSFIYVNGLEDHYKDDNLFYSICNYYNDNPTETLTNIGNKFKTARKTVATYLHAGYNIGIIQTNPFDITENSNTKKRKRRRSYMISVSRDGQHIGDYTSVFLCYQGLQTTDYDNLPTRDNLYGAIRRHYEQHSQFSYRNFDFNVTNDKEALWT